jgi:hypothetical protein
MQADRETWDYSLDRAQAAVEACVRGHNAIGSGKIFIVWGYPDRATELRHAHDAQPNRPALVNFSEQDFDAELCLMTEDHDARYGTLTIFRTLTTKGCIFCVPSQPKQLHDLFQQTMPSVKIELVHRDVDGGQVGVVGVLTSVFIHGLYPRSLRYALELLNLSARKVQAFLEKVYGVEGADA